MVNIPADIDDTVPLAEVADVELYHPKSWWTTYVFSQDAKVIAIQYSVTAISIGFVALVLSWLMRIQLAFPGALSFIDAEHYYQFITMHGMIMVIYLLTALFLGGFGNYLIPLMLVFPIHFADALKLVRRNFIPLIDQRARLARGVQCFLTRPCFNPRASNRTDDQANGNAQLLVQLRAKKESNCRAIRCCGRRNRTPCPAEIGGRLPVKLMIHCEKAQSRMICRGDFLPGSFD